ncbi:MAG: hypothetical protein E7C05_03050 [Clostridium botulinum]|jgi:hypothetical protein|nr:MULTISPECIES: hypothetical protein [Clostridium]MBA4508044.1 hypothetical protein [Clostridium sporogenes]MDU2831533.1 hypothetical protein [Clostridium botulinum]MDU5116395.1 hypothetical protein [Clostridium botulinum]
MMHGKIIFSISGSKVLILEFTDFKHYKSKVSIKIDGVEYSYFLTLSHLLENVVQD